MDAIELDAMPKSLRVLLLQLADFVEAGLKDNPTSAGNSIGEPC